MRILAIAVICCAGCAAAHQRPVELTWTGDGNDGTLGSADVAVCGARDCKTGFEVRDETAGTSTPLPITSRSYLGSDATHRYAIRTVGLDHEGSVLVSPWEEP